jgi:hypothetical protein
LATRSCPPRRRDDRRRWARGHSDRGRTRRVGTPLPPDALACDISTQRRAVAHRLDAKHFRHGCVRRDPPDASASGGAVAGPEVAAAIEDHPVRPWHARHPRSQRVHVGGGQPPDHTTLVPIGDVEAAAIVPGQPGGTAAGCRVANRTDLEHRATRIDLPERTPSLRQRGAARRVKIPVFVARQPFDGVLRDRERCERRVVGHWLSAAAIEAPTEASIARRTVCVRIEIVLVVRDGRFYCRDRGRATQPATLGEAITFRPSPPLLGSRRAVPIDANHRRRPAVD